MVHLQQQRKNDVYQRTTDSIVQAIEQGAGTYQMPWHRRSGFGRPRNASSGRAYSGVNVLALWAAADKKHYGSELWATYKQWESLEAHVRKGEKGTPIVFFKEIEPEPGSENTGDDARPRFFAKTCPVFNADQVDDFSAPEPQKGSLVEILQAADALVASTGADLRHGGDHAFYDRRNDYIRIPHRESFTGTSTSTPTESYYAVLFHELTHWTGHGARLNRDLAGRFGDNCYAMEELVAEVGAAFLCSDLGVANSPRQDHAAYIASWLSVLKADSKAVFTAARKAAEAAEYVAGCTDRGHPLKIGSEASAV